jgi:uncharacterized membrane protein YfcA
MDIFILGAVGIIGGIIGGMGMGGGTLLIPLLSIFFSMQQQNAQAINLIAFIPMAIVALIIHLKNKLIVFKDVLLIITFGIITSLLGSFLAKSMDGDLLKKCFGGFLIILSIYQFVSQFFKKKKSNYKKSIKNSENNRKTQ